ncbi:ABC transporter permease subunit [Streptomyces sp. MP131-18]|uniref:ABC transporter permease n=1 Tax=Streptomyces sp. MP131-18 TaxID=1857892 RepID=UPI00097BF285|nr:ABC transporter permease subunit [Streptomyces sp. MP131-18]ONK10221.1 putative aliphatic sulfonates transport permeaseprotein SsuC [Streptomyces sp. MP131-18]
MSIAPPAPPARLRGALAAGAPALAVGAAVVLLWQLLVTATGVQSFILPSPTDIFGALLDELPTILRDARVTLAAVLLGMALGGVSGLLGALLLTRLGRISGPLLTVAVILNCAPVVALAPIANNWLGVTSIWSKACVAGLMVFFPVLVNTTRGLRDVDTLHLELMSALAARPRHTLLLVRLPRSLPFFFNGLRLGAAASVIGVIVSEYFGGPSQALGVYIANQAALSRFAETWAGVLAASVMGLALFAVVAGCESRLVPWQRHRHDGDT